MRKEFWLDPEILQRAQKILGTATERETVEVALDMIAFRRELLDGTRALAGLEIDSIRWIRSVFSFEFVSPFPPPQSS